MLRWVQKTRHVYSHNAQYGTQHRFLRPGRRPALALDAQGRAEAAGEGAGWEAAMSIVDDVRDALKPLGNVVHDVLPGAFASYEGALVSAGTSVAILLNIDDPDSYRHDIE